MPHEAIQILSKALQGNLSVIEQLTGNFCFDTAI
jgi:hypothetical protein